jgi:hypothetical protein
MDFTDINRQLRRQFDSKDPFMTRGCGLVKPRSNDSKKTPAWASNDAKVRQLVYSRFPEYQTKQRHRNSAARWIRIIQLYWRMGKTEGQTAAEMESSDLTPTKVNRYIGRIQTVAKRLFPEDYVTEESSPVDQPRFVTTRGTPPRSRGGRRPGAGRKKASQKSKTRRY